MAKNPIDKKNIEEIQRSFTYSSIKDVPFQAEEPSFSMSLSEKKVSEEEVQKAAKILLEVI